MDRRITIIRAVMLLLLAMVVLPYSFWLFYAITLLLIGLMMPVLGTGISCSPCTVDTAHNSMQFVVTGVTTTGGGCTSGTCGGINATWVVDSPTSIFDPPRTCHYTVHANSAACNAFTSNLSTGVQVGLDGTDIIIMLTIHFDSDLSKSMGWQSATYTGISEIDCGFSGVSVPPSFNAYAKCDNSASSVTCDAI